MTLRFDRLTQLLLLAVTVLVYSVVGMAIANSLFVSYVGAQQLPLAFILIGLCSMPAYAVFSQIIDSYSRPLLFRYVLLGSVFVMFGLRLLLTQDAPYVYYVLLIAIFFQWDFHNNVLYPSLLTDYFTTLEYKRYAPYIGIAQAVGTLLGGGLTALLSHYLRTRDLLLCLPVVFLIGFVQLVYLESSQRRVNSDQAPQSVGIWESIRTFPDLVQRYPLAIFLASSSFLLVIIYISSEFLWFNIYGAQFSDQALTGFLGLMRVVISLVQVAVIYGVTRPLLKTVGVARMNPLYPLTTLASFAGLLSHVGLPAAIGLHVNGDGLYKGINIPVHQLNYNAIPQEFLGRIRALSDGLIYSVGLTLAGVLLWLAETRLSLVQIAWLVAGLTVGLLLVRLPMGRYYASGLEGMIRSDSLDLDEFDLMPVSLNPQSGEAVKELLRDSDRYSQQKGLELAARMGAPDPFLPEVEALMRAAGGQDAQLMEGAIALFSPCSAELQTHFQQALADPQLRDFAWEVLLINRAIPADLAAERLLTAAASSSTNGATVATYDNGQQTGHVPSRLSEDIARASDSPASLTPLSTEHQVLTALTQLMTDASTKPCWPETLTGPAARILTRVVAYSRDAELAPLISEVVLTQAAPDILRTGLEALVPLAQRGDQPTADIACRKLTHADPMVRIAALDLLRITRCEATLPTIGQCLSDDDPRVRQQAARAIAAFGRAGIALAKAHLSPAADPPQPATLNAAITAIGLVRTRYASNVLFDYLSPSYAQLAETRRWQSQIPMDASSWAPLGIAIADYHDRLIQQVLYVLSALGYARTVNAVNRFLATGARTELENAIEVLASLRHRRFVLPLMPLFEQLVATPSPVSAPQVTPQWLKTKGYRLLLEALESNDRWIKSGALVALASVPAALVRDPDPVVNQIASQIFQDNSPVTTTMNRLLLLKTIRLFKNLSLDELMLIDESLEQTQVIAGETIFTEGDLAAHLYIVAEGDVQLIKDIDGVPRSLKQITKGDYFGEVALFDDAPLWDSAIAQTDCTLLKLEKNRFLSLITQRPHMILEICRFLSQRLRETDRVRSENASGVR
ncbi:MAG: cyclic nucleotide-binding domain-containing protein [Cyanobacteria bacterium J06607_13]